MAPMQNIDLIIKDLIKLIKKLDLPIEIKEGEEKIESAKYEEGVLVLIIPVTKKSKNISIE